MLSCMLQTGSAPKTKESSCCIPGGKAASNVQTPHFYDFLARPILFDTGTSHLCTPDEPIWWSWVFQCFQASTETLQTESCVRLEE